MTWARVNETGVQCVLLDRGHAAENSPGEVGELVESEFLSSSDDERPSTALLSAATDGAGVTPPSWATSPPSSSSSGCFKQISGEKNVQIIPPPI